MTEATQYKMQVVTDGETVLLDIEPPVPQELQERIQANHSFYDIPEGALVFRERTPDRGEPFTEINCTDLARTMWKEKRLELEPVNVAQDIAEVLRNEGNQVVLETHPKPVEQSGYLFLGLQAKRPGS